MVIKLLHNYRALGGQATSKKPATKWEHLSQEQFSSPPRTFNDGVILLRLFSAAYEYAKQVIEF